MDSQALGVRPELANIRPQFDLHLFDRLSSTSTQLWQMLAAETAKAGSVVIARQQSAGRGQRSRSWQSSPGGLYLSLALEPDWPVARSAQLTCLSAWGIATALHNLGIPIDIKWPNDLYFKGKKLGGILTETKLAQASSSTESALIKQAVIGVGINWHNPVPKTGVTLASILGDLPTAVDKNKINCLEMLIAVVLRGILQGYIFQQQVGSQVFMKAYRKLLTQVGSTVLLDGDGLLSLSTPVLPPSPDATQPGSSRLHQMLTAKTQATQHYSRLHTPSDRENLDPDAKQWANRSGEVIGVSEEGYLQVAVHSLACRRASQKVNSQTVSTQKVSQPTTNSISADNILLFKPSEIHIS